MQFCTCVFEAVRFKLGHLSSPLPLFDRGPKHPSRRPQANKLTDACRVLPGTRHAPSSRNTCKPSLFSCQSLHAGCMRTRISNNLSKNPPCVHPILPEHTCIQATELKQMPNLIAPMHMRPKGPLAALGNTVRECELLMRLGPAYVPNWALTAYPLCMHNLTLLQLWFREAHLK